MASTTNYLANILGDDPEALLALREVPAFHQCSVPLLELVYRYGKVVLLREGEELTREGEFDQWVYFIISGKLTVHVGEERIDTISSSLVGERCILGEQRRATLRAAEGGVSALGVDMALLDALRDTETAGQEPIAVYMELLSIIAGEVVNRIVDLEFNLLDFSYKYQVHNRTERLSDILRGMAEGAFAADRQASFAIHRVLSRRDPVALSRCSEGGSTVIDTRRLYADAVLSGNHGLLYEVAEAVQAVRDEPQREVAEAAPAEAEHRFSAFVERVARTIAEQHGRRQFSEAAVPALMAGIRKRLSLNESLKVDLPGLMQWLVDAQRFTAEDNIDLLMSLLKEASDYTGLINGQIKGMVQELTQTRFAKELETAVLTKGMSAVEYYHSTPLEELIPFFSKNILDVYLVQPYLDRLHTTPDEGAAFQDRGRNDALLETLFD